MEQVTEDDADVEADVARGFHRCGFSCEGGLHRSLEAVGLPLEYRRRPAFREGILIRDHDEVAGLGAEAWSVAPARVAVGANEELSKLIALITNPLSGVLLR